MISENNSKIKDDIEFLNILSNPEYIQFLIHHKYPWDKDFLKYLKSLSYIKNS